MLAHVFIYNKRKQNRRKLFMCKKKIPSNILESRGNIYLEVLERL